MKNGLLLFPFIAGLLLTAQTTGPVSSDYDATQFGIYSGCADCTTQLNGLIQTVFNNGGGVIHLPSGTIGECGGFVMTSLVTLRGAGRGVTTLQQKPGCGSTTGVVYGPYNAYSLWGNLSALGIYDFGLEDLSIDANKGNNYNPSDSLALFGYRYHLKRVEMKHAARYNLHTEGGQPVGDSMESDFEQVLLDDSGFDGAYMDGPHDSHMHGFIVIDAGQSGNGQFCGLDLGPHMNVRATEFHGWHRGSVANRVAAQLCVQGSGSTFASSHFEGAWGSNVFLNTGAAYNSFACDNAYYAAWNGLNILVRGSNNYICGTVMDPGAGRPGSVAVQLGDGTPGENPAANHIDLMVNNNTGGMIRFYHDTGLNMIRLTGWQPSGPKWVGSYAANDDIDLIGGGAGSNIHLHP